MADPRQRQLKIKTGVVRRIFKEEKSYKSESKQHEEKVQTMKEDGSDEYLIKKQNQLLQESTMMIGDCHHRLEAACESLSQLLETEKEIEDTEEYKAACEILKEVGIEF
uniref:Tubulin-specific chaperone A n=1 Tax=Eptatretus burgeri TaxID=7764 RepID=A0A8C4NGY3_EPTBU